MHSSTPKRSLAECDALLCAPGGPCEMETRLIDGRLQRVYKDLPASLRDFWLRYSSDYIDRTYIVYEGRRCTFADIRNSSLIAAAIFRDVYHIQKGDRIVICSRNLPEYLAAYWACHLIGAVSVLVNAWLPLQPLLHCIKHSGSRLIISDPERADRLLPALPDLTKAGVGGFIVFDSPVVNPAWEKNGIQQWSRFLEYNRSRLDWQSILTDSYHITPEDYATIVFTSGTTGLPKGVLSTQRQYLTNTRNAFTPAARALLRKGEAIPASPQDGPQKGVLLAVPLFHVSGITSLATLATMMGNKIVMMRKWNPEEGAILIRQENVRFAGGVALIVSEIVDSSLNDYVFDGLLFGGTPAHPKLPFNAKKAFPGSQLSQTYGMTETNSVAVGISGEEYEEKPTSAGYPSPVNDLKIIRDDVAVPTGEIGEVWIRGANTMKEYWGDPKATAETLTRDGWLKTGDLGSVDADGCLYIHDRIKDLINRGGEKIASASVENVILEDPRISSAAAVGVPDDRYGEQCAVVVSTKPEHHGQLNEMEIIERAKKSLPKFAVPALVLIQTEPFELTASGKALKAPLRDRARAEWARRKKVFTKSRM
ncbi:hypothetical protein ABKN59_000591 [Abortiporus biennis]